jgi:regulator of sigma E protease
VVLHELGHFIPAKLFKTRVNKFYLFFDFLFPFSNVFPFSLFKKKIGDTTYGIGWFPMGGYVDIAGMIDESKGADQLATEPQPWEFRSKPAWQKLIIMLGGITVNFFLAWFIYSCLSYFNGETFHANDKFKEGIGVTPEGEKIGLKSGDKILKIDGKPAQRMENSFINILLSDSVTVLRGGKEVTFKTEEDGIADVLKDGQAKMFFMPRFPVAVGSVGEGYRTKFAGLEKGDKIVGINDEPIKFYDELLLNLNKNKDKIVNLQIIRKDVPISIEIPVSVGGKLGFIPDDKVIEAAFNESKETKNYSLLQAIPRGFQRSIESLTTQVKQFKIIFSEKVQGYKQVGGPIAIVKMMPVNEEKGGGFSPDWIAFWSFTAMFSVWLAFLNLIPIPGLDGGHAVFALWELITGKPASEKVIEVAQTIGMILLFGLMALIFGADIYKAITGKLNF